MPTFDFSALPATMMRPIVVAIGHLPIVAIVFFMVPMWISAAFRPKTHTSVLKFITELRNWSAQVVSGSAARPKQDTK
jgi:hypothetical protein